MWRREVLLRFLMAIRRDRVDEGMALLQKSTESGEVTAAALLVRQRPFEIVKGFGKAQGATPFLLASITKPMTAAGVMVLRDRGELSLDDAVRKYLPQFTGGDRDLITIRHLLTHTSGLPDMLPENEDLRKRHAPLQDFVNLTMKTPLLFKPGSQVRYQSMGILLASAVAERITKTPFRDFLKKEVFLPLGMKQTSLGLGGRRIADMAPSQVPEKSNWDWNSPYWRDLGAPWGGAHANVHDVATFLEVFRHDEAPIFKKGTTREMITNQIRGHKESWGLGWRLNPGIGGRASSKSTYGHSGSTGTLSWCDPESATTFVLLTTKPAAQSQKVLLRPVSDLVSEAAANTSE
jgi:CubicO group peptidase (beta-lactamase class C family)